MIHLFQHHFIFVVLTTLNKQIDSNTHFIVTILDTFTGQTFQIPFHFDGSW